MRLAAARNDEFVSTRDSPFDQPFRNLHQRRHDTTAVPQRQHDTSHAHDALQTSGKNTTSGANCKLWL